VNFDELNNALGIKQHVEQIRTNVFIQRYKRFLFLPRFYVFNDFYFFSRTFLHNYMADAGDNGSALILATNAQLELLSSTTQLYDTWCRRSIISCLLCLSPSLISRFQCVTR